MEEYSDVHAPQWMDLTKSLSPQLSTPDFFDKVHRKHERNAEEERGDSTFEDAENADPQRGLATEKYGSAKLREESAMKRTPVKVISPTSRGGDPPTVEYTTYDEVLGDAMRKLDLCKRTLPPRTQNGMNRTVQESADFKTPAKPAKSSRSVAGFRSLPHKGVPVVSSSKRSAWTGRSVCTPTGGDVAAKQPKKKISVSLSLFKRDEERAKKVEAPTQEAPQVPLGDSVDGANGEECRSEEVEVARDEKGGEMEVTEGNNEETRGTKEELHEEPEENESKAREDDKEEGGRDAARHAGGARPSCLGQSLHKVLTWQNHRRTTFGSARRASVCKKYVSLAEAVSRFQNETPKRFRTRSAKECASVSVGAKPAAPSHPPRPTVPISPALVSKNRARPVKALSREERELLEMEEIRKHRIKANPVPRSVLRGPRPAKQDEAKSTSAPAERQSGLPSRGGLSAPRGSRSDLATVTTVLVTDADGIVVKREEISSFGVPPVPKSVTRVEPFSFEARSRELQRRKQERLRCQQQDQAAKPEFHARPAPNFTKPPAAATTKQQQQQQQQPAARRQVVPRPFSFDERDKQIPQKKEQLVKQVLEEEKRSRLFRANPAPVFKCVQPAGAKSRLTRTAESLHEDRKEAEEPAKKPVGNVNCPNKPKKAAAAPSLPKKGHSFELNTDKRARERREFDEKIRRKELEEEALRREKVRQEQERERQMRAEMRRLAEVRARPMPAFKPPVLVRHAKPLTDPQSPAFASKLNKLSKQQ